MFPTQAPTAAKVARPDKVRGVHDVDILCKKRFPYIEKDKSGRMTYREESNGNWERWERGDHEKGKYIKHEKSDGYQSIQYHDGRVPTSIEKEVIKYPNGEETIYQRNRNWSSYRLCKKTDGTWEKKIYDSNKNLRSIEYSSGVKEILPKPKADMTIFKFILWIFIGPFVLPLMIPVILISFFFTNGSVKSYDDGMDDYFEDGGPGCD